MFCMSMSFSTTLLEVHEKSPCSFLARASSSSLFLYERCISLEALELMSHIFIPRLISVTVVPSRLVNEMLPDPVAEDLLKIRFCSPSTENTSVWCLQVNILMLG